MKKLAAKVDDYNERLESGKASKIKPDHVQKVLEKLRRKSAKLEEELASTASMEKRARLEKKLSIARAHIERGEWLLREIS
ncbi:hypothetical protein [Aestuariivita boseongensis]|uniref:hypothetical protein n=1 Tax=Aestuariivita boseongensis TaxID=1470562 RepID=UPI0012FA42B1|nr:hypothetical protein [Aestuariivita boseongensis]